ncbi:MAG: FecR domain-containing protein [Balneolaceae bacterium]|nr:FecR domain-containing protein [Balneolaceae bacterium]
MNKKIVENFFSNQATPGETRKVLEWFETPEGQQYLRERLDVDEDLMTRTELRELVPELDSEQVYSSIRQRIGKSERTTFKKRVDWLGPLVKVAAAILVVLSASLFYMLHQPGQEEAALQEPIHFQTEEEQHREVTLGDGTIVRLNSNSEMTVSADFMKGAREVTLSGEAYFNVEHDPENPFIIHANQSSVEVLGTAFNVRSIKGMDNVQVAVEDGKVAFRSTNGSPDAEQLSVTLSRGQYGYMDITQRIIQVDDLAVENYLAWKNGRFIFDGLTLSQVCTQLNRIYNTECSFENDEIRNLQITSIFADDSLEKALDVIALSLGLEFEAEGGRVYWKPGT